MAVTIDGTTGISASGNIVAGGNITVGGTLTANTYAGNIAPENMTATGNVQAANLTATANLDGANLNIASDAVILGNLSVTGNAQLSGNILGDRITNGTTSFEIQTAGGNANVSVGGVSNVVVITTAGQLVTGIVSASGNVSGGNITTAGRVSATGNVFAGNLNATGLNLTGNVIGNLATAGNITAGNLIANDGIYGNMFTTLIDSDQQISITVSGEDSTSKTWYFGNDGDLTFPDGTTQTTAPVAQVYPDAGIAVSNGSAWSTSLTAPSGDIVGTTDTQTLTSKRVDPRTSSDTTYTTLTPNIADFDQYNITDQTGALTVAEPIGTPVDGNKLLFRIFTTTAGSAITWNATYTVIGTTLPTVTVTDKTIYVGCIYNAANTRWDVIAVTTQL